MKSLSTLRIACIIGIGSQLLMGCASFQGAESSENLSKLKYGMSQSQVLNVLGTPDTVVAPKTEHARWIYEFKSADKKGRNFYIDFSQDGLAKTGELSGREIAAASEDRYNGSCTKNVHREMLEESRCIR